MSKTTRRELLQWSAMVGFGVWVQDSEAWFATKSPNEKVNLAMIGTANRAKSNMREMGALNKENVSEKNFSENIVALADVDSRFVGQAGEEFPKAKLYGDWRKMLEQKDIDAVLVATPDHTHAHAVIAALQLGKHVYSEKPLTHNVYEARRVLEEAKKAKTATQMGTQI